MLQKFRKDVYPLCYRCGRMVTEKWHLVCDKCYFDLARRKNRANSDPFLSQKSESS